MSSRTGPVTQPLRPDREKAAWRGLVGFQLVVLALIVLSLVVVVLVGALGSLFTQGRF